MPITSKTRTITVDLAVATAAYADGDVVGGLLDLRGLCDGQGGVIKRIVLTDDDAEDAAFVLHLFDALPSTIADNAAFAPTIADVTKRIGSITIDTYETVGSESQAIVGDIDIDHGTGVLYAYLVTAASTPTYTAATDLTLRVTGMAD